METVLTPQQEAFCLAWSKTGNATQSYKDAGYKATNDNSAAASASALLKRPKIQKRIQELMAKANRAKIMDIKETQERLSNIARRLETEDVYLADGTAIPKPAGRS